MKKLAILFFSALLILGCNQQKATTDEWKLVWSDEFDYEGLPDSTKWSFEEGYVRNKELQYYTKNRLENARVKDGMLVLEARQDNFENHEITAASIETQDKQHFLYGRIEVKAKLPAGIGTWPAIWLLGAEYHKTKGWPDCGEIDILENVGYDITKVHANIHTKAYNHVKKTNKGGTLEVDDPSQDFNIYALEWYKDRMEFFFNDTKYFTFENEGTGWETWPFDQEHYLLLNFAFGGSWGGREGVDKSVLPQKYLIDYVRYYQK